MTMNGGIDTRRASLECVPASRLVVSPPTAGRPAARSKREHRPRPAVIDAVSIRRSIFAGRSPRLVVRVSSTARVRIDRSRHELRTTDYGTGSCFSAAFTSSSQFGTYTRTRSLFSRLHHVARLQVAMNDASRVRRANGVREWNCHVQQTGDRQAIRWRHFSERLSLDEFHREEVVAATLLD